MPLFKSKHRKQLKRIEAIQQDTHDHHHEHDLPDDISSAAPLAATGPELDLVWSSPGSTSTLNKQFADDPVWQRLLKRA